ncbi:PREDICTED: uncharacterized protein LOC108978693 [Bactrocera latifrons]|uniref:uncharacterized protein LOC108978693 n=1 Tax=Bactrocera latifrons TaxID=174628 RepID=UPI0008DC962A|nr:PREDICTED: uncharacterized protein LOC108978693 [Bactrocera latifrons]
MGRLRILTLLLCAISYYVLCSCKFSDKTGFQLNDYHNAFRHSIAALRMTDDFLGPLRVKRSQKYDNFVQYPSRETEIAPHLGFDRIPLNDYNRIVSALKEMLRARDEKPVMLRPRPGRRSAVGEAPLWQYFIDEADNLNLNTADTVAIVGDEDDALTDTSLKKSAPFKPRLGKRGEVLKYQ